MNTIYRIIPKQVTTKDKKTFTAFKLVDDDNNGRLIDCVMCKGVKADQISEIAECHKAEITGEVQISQNYEFPKAFVKSIDSIKKIS